MNVDLKGDLINQTLKVKLREAKNYSKADTRLTQGGRKADKKLSALLGLNKLNWLGVCKEKQTTLEDLIENNVNTT